MSLTAEEVRKIVRSEKPFWRWLLLFFVLIALQGKIGDIDRRTLSCAPPQVMSP